METFIEVTLFYAQALTFGLMMEEFLLLDLERSVDLQLGALLLLEVG